MNGENPYAPPAVAETEAGSSRYWRLYGTSIIVRNGTTLPEVDLESGISGDEGALRPVQRIHQNASGGAIIRMLVLIVLYLVLNTYFEISGISVFIYFMIGTLLLRRFMVLRGSQNARIAIWTFTEERRAKRAALRRSIRIGALGLLLMTVFVTPLLNVSNIGTWMLGGYFCWLGLVLALAIWALFDRPKYKIHSADPGWLRITPVHPKALEFLSTIEAAEQQQHAGGGLPRKRLIRTVYLHRFPLRMLIGRINRNPLMMLQIALMKLFRSRLLVREAYHFSEAEDAKLSDLCPPLREACETWLSTHAGWIFVSGEHLTAPAGDLRVETAHLASPGLEHCLRVTRAWMQHTPQKSANQFTFLTWIDDGSEHISTCDQPFIALRNPQFHHRAKGDPEAVHQAHLGHIAGFSIHRPQDAPALLRLLQADKQKTDRLLVERKLQSEVRETES